MMAENRDDHDLERTKVGDGGMDAVKDNESHSPRLQTRREFLKLSAAATATAALGGSLLWGCGDDSSGGSATTGGTDTTTQAGAASTATTGAALAVKPGDRWTSLRASRENLYSVWVDKAQKLVAEAYDLKYQMLINDYKPEIELSQMESEIQKGVKMFSVNTPGPGVVPALAKLCQDNQAAMVNNWDQPDWWMPHDAGEFYVAYLIPPTVEPAYKLAKYLFTKMGGEGGFIHMAGMPGGVADWGRTMGVDMALKEFPNIKLLARQNTGWTRAKSRPVMDDFIIRFGDEIKGVFGQADDTAIGCMNALEAVGMKVPVVGIDGNPETFDLVEQGRFAATVTNLPTYIAGWSFALMYDFLNGYKFSPVERVQHWECYLIDDTNVRQARAKFYPDNDSDIHFDWRKMSKVLHPDDWDPQNKITCMKWEEFWAPRPKPEGYEMPKEYTDAVAAGERERIDQMYADHYKMDIMEGVPEVNI